MTKRSAITMAAGLAASLLFALAAVALMVGDASVARAGGEGKPIVKRQVQTVTVHRKAHTDASRSVHVVHLGSGSAAGSSSMSAFDDEGFEPDGDGSFDGGAVESSQSQDGSSQGNVGDD
jgi:hypothetical protein